MSDRNSSRWKKYKDGQVRVPVHPAFVLVPFIVPLITPVATVLSAVVLGGLAIVAAIAGLGGTASSGSVIAGLIGAAIAGGLSIAVSTFFYYALPPLFFFLAIVTYVLISLGEQLSGRRLIAKILNFEMNVRLICFLSIMIVGGTTFLVFAVFDYFNLFSDEYRSAERAFWRSVGSYKSEIGPKFEVVFRYLFDINVLYFLITIISIAWIIVIMLGVNFYISRSVEYCVEVYILAFVLDLIFTICAAGAIEFGDLDQSAVVESLNNLDWWLRYIAMLPIQLLSWVFSDLADLAEALRDLISSVSLLFSKLIEIGVKTVFIADTQFKIIVLHFIDLSQLLKVDFIFFLISSIIWYLKLSGMGSLDDSNPESNPDEVIEKYRRVYVAIAKWVLISFAFACPILLIFWNGIQAALFPQMFDFRYLHETRQYSSFFNNIDTDCVRSVRIIEKHWFWGHTYTCTVRTGFEASHSTNVIYMVFWSIVNSFLILIAFSLLIGSAILIDAAHRHVYDKINWERVIEEAVDSACARVINAFGGWLIIILILAILSGVLFEIRAAEAFKSVR